MFLEWRFGEDLHKIKEGTGCLSTLHAQNTADNGTHPIHKLEYGEQWENGRDETDHL